MHISLMYGFLLIWRLYGDAWIDLSLYKSISYIVIFLQIVVIYDFKVILSLLMIISIYVCIKYLP